MAVKYDLEACWPVVLEKIQSGMSVRQICSEPGMPCRTVVKGWIKSSPDRQREYAEACSERAEALAEALEAICDEPIPPGLDGPAQSAFIQRQRLRVDTRKWIASKLAPKRYGEKLEIETNVQIDLASAMAAAQKRVESRRALMIEGEATVLRNELDPVRARTQLTTEC